MTPSTLIKHPPATCKRIILAAFLAIGFFTSAVRAETINDIPESIRPDARNIDNLAQKIREGQTVRVGFLGGSITQGAGAKKPANSYYAQTRGHLTAFAKDTGAKVETRLAAVGGTGTLYGACRLGIQLLGKTPLDLLIVEFAVNDFQNPGALDGMEGIVRQALTHNPRMAVVLFYTTNRRMIEECYDKDSLPPSVTAFHRIARHYNLAEVHAGPKVRALFRENRITPENFFPDKTHPSEDGHAFYANLLSDSLIAALKAAPPPPPPPPPPAFPAPLGSGQLEYARLLPLIPVEKSENWTAAQPGYYTYFGAWKTASPGANMSFDATGERIYLLCGKTSRIRISGLDTGEKTLVPKNRRNGTPAMQLIHAGPEKFSGRITITVEPDAQGNINAELAGIAAINTPAPPQ